MSHRLKPVYDLAVIGAGPAGLAAAAEAASLGLDTVLFDEQRGPGGQIYRGLVESKLSGRQILGDDYWRGERLVTAIQHDRVAYIPESIVWAVLPNLEIGLSIKGQGVCVRAKNILVATGAVERPFPIGGWTLPGVLTVGAGQILLKTSALVPSGRLVMAGSGPLLWLLAAQYLQAGVRIEAILDTTPAQNVRSATRHFVSFALSPYFAKGIKMLSRVLREVRVVRNVESLEAEGDDCLRAVIYRTRGWAAPVRLNADTLLLHQGVAPNINLTQSIGCDHEWDDRQLSFRPVSDPFGETSVENIFVAGDGAGIVGAHASEFQGRLAAVAVAHREGRLDQSQFSDLSGRHRLYLRRWLPGRAFLDTIFRPADQFRIPPDDIVICRCEEVTAGQLREAVRLGCSGPNQAKAFLRCGMGPCQGRFCGLTVTEIIARERHVSAAGVGYFRTRAPVKPVTLTEIAALPVTAEAVAAVVRDLPAGVGAGQ